ncbi:UNVERIFIED_CONTAM: hypothetical protein Sangu_1189200 [Sesamum angustifolium]|uniref:Uncharacterized protein n=1 Tax=Sesamum angustifolium TaxID=2727405 RepID=A0AAW2NI91_9LAMI
MQEEVESWPYSFPLSEDFVKSNKRGAVSGQLLVDDWYKNKGVVPGASAYVGLAPPGAAGSWQFQSKVSAIWTLDSLPGSVSTK